MPWPVATAFLWTVKSTNSSLVMFVVGVSLVRRARDVAHHRLKSEGFKRKLQGNDVR